jgi:phage shock protein A
MGWLRGLKQGLDRLLAPAEDPRQTPLDSLRERQSGALQILQRSLNEIQGAQAAMDRRIEQLDAQAADFEGRARQALLDGRPDLARSCLLRRRSVLAELDGLRAQADRLQQEYQRVAPIEQDLASRLDALAAREEALHARFTAAEAQARAHEWLVESLNELAAIELPLREIEERAEWMRARSEALEQLNQDDAAYIVPRGTAVDEDIDRDLQCLLSDVQAERGRG